MEDKIKLIIDSEDKKNPLTDEEISSQLGMLREIVTEYRREQGIPDSRERRKALIIKDAVDILRDNINISERSFAKELNDRGYMVARFAAANIKKQALELVKGNYESSYEKKEAGQIFADEKKEHDPFESIIGYEGSLKLQVNQAKAAILYPPKGLHTLLLGPSGVGKSHMAEAMYNFAKTTKNFSENVPFMVFNCADYADNPQLLLSQLFGHVKDHLLEPMSIRKV